MDHGSHSFGLSEEKRNVYKSILTNAIALSKKIHNQTATRSLMNQLFDSQMVNLADFDCFSQVVFESIEDYKKIKQDPWYKEHLMHDHENFADTKRSM
jgi:hypothetical protein